MHRSSPETHGFRNRFLTQVVDGVVLHMTKKLQAPSDLCDVRLIFLVESHLIFDRLICVNYCAMIAPAKMQSNSF